MGIGNIFEHFPEIYPDDSITIEDESHDFVVLNYEDGTSSTKYTYMLDKAPVERIREVRGTVDDTTYTFEQGTDYALVDDDNDGEVDSIDFSVGGKQPDDNTAFYTTYVAQPIISRFAEGHSEETTVTSDKIAAAIESHQIDNAEGTELDHLGSLFGELGKRRGRNDDEYRAFIKSIVQSFNGRGTLPGLRFAIAAGIGAEPDNININEDFEKVGYTIRIENTDTSFLSGVINEMADLADPSGVELLSAPVIVLDGETIVTNQTGTTITSSSVGLGGNALSMDGSGTLK